MEEINRKDYHRPWWAFPLGLIVLQVASRYSISYLYIHQASDVYLPISIGIAMTYWLGPKALFLVFINGILNGHLWGHTPILSWPVFALSETLFVFLSWFLFTKLGKGKIILNNLKTLVQFIVLGIAIPLTIQTLATKGLIYYFGEWDGEQFTQRIISAWLGDFMVHFAITPVLLYFLSDRMRKWGISIHRLPVPKFEKKLPVNYFRYELTALLCLIFGISLFVDFSKFWYLYGLITLIFSIRFGFRGALLLNFFVFMVTFVLPSTLNGDFSALSTEQLIYVYMGNNLLSIFTLITARVISDTKNSQMVMQFQNKELEQANKELDQFAYSVSHDLSAPLKSIKGLIYLMKKENITDNIVPYINMIENSAIKLDNFILEILDFSRNSRGEIKYNTINLEETINEIVDSHLDNHSIEKKSIVKMSGVKGKYLFTDLLRIKIILNNLISNAIKFSQQAEKPEILITYRKIQGNGFLLSVKDNGPGIPPEHVNRIFEMFYRASDTVPGSGLGLYIALEAAKKINCSLNVKSEVGQGASFILKSRAIPT